jgi:hypothetical protein
MRFGPAPKPDLMIIASWSKQMTFWMPCEPPDHCSMSLLYGMKVTSICIPIHNLSIVRGTGKQFLFKWMPCDDCNLVIMFLKHIELLHHSNVQYFYRRISRSSEKPVPVNRIPPDLIDRVIMRLKGLHLTSISRIPKLNLIIFAPCHNQRFSGMPVAGFHIWTMPLKSHFFLWS